MGWIRTANVVVNPENSRQVGACLAINGQPECSEANTHAIVLTDFRNGVAKVLNSWGTRWGVSGYKRIRPCGPTELLGVTGMLVYPYSF